jgi:hypothetical protein
MEIYVKAYAATGWRKWWPYMESAKRGGATDPVGSPPPGWKPRSRLERLRRW